MEQNKEVDDVPCASFRSRRVGSETNELKINLNQLSEEQKSRLLDSLRNAKGSPETSVLSNANAQATLVFAPSSQNSMS